MSKPNTPTYKTLNWPAYNKALKRRGSLAIWFDPTMAWKAEPTGRRGRKPGYSDAAIQTCLTKKVLLVRSVSGNPYRYRALPKWVSAFVMPLPSQASAG
mgnify:CR=1 FL=1